MQWPIVLEAVQIQVHVAFLQSVTDLHYELKIEWIKAPEVLVPRSQILTVGYIYVCCFLSNISDAVFECLCIVRVDLIWER